MMTARRSNLASKKPDAILFRATFRLLRRSDPKTFCPLSGSDLPRLHLCGLSRSSSLGYFCQTTQLSARLLRSPRASLGSKLRRAAWRCVTSPLAPANPASAVISPRQHPPPLPCSAASFTVWMDDVIFFSVSDSSRRIKDSFKLFLVLNQTLLINDCTDHKRGDN